MVKFKYLFLFLVVIFISFAKNIEEIEDMTLNIEERLSLNGDIKKSEYILQYIKPDFIRKDILSPELNKGEIYIYDSKKKVIYLPLFDQVSEEILNEEEDSTLEAINYILKEKKEFKEGKINLKDGLIIELKKLKKFSEYTLPEVIIIYDGNVKVGELKIKNYKINSKLNKEELSLHD